MNINGAPIHHSTSMQVVFKSVLWAILEMLYGIVEIMFWFSEMVPTKHILADENPKKSLLTFGFVRIWSPNPNIFSPTKIAKQFRKSDMWITFWPNGLSKKSINFIAKMLELQWVRESRWGSGLLRVPWARIPTSPPCTPILLATHPVCNWLRFWRVQV